MVQRCNNVNVSIVVDAVSRILEQRFNLKFPTPFIFIMLLLHVFCLCLIIGFVFILIRLLLSSLFLYRCLVTSQVINHMAAGSGKGTAGSAYGSRSFTSKWIGLNCWSFSLVIVNALSVNRLTSLFSIDRFPSAERSVYSPNDFHHNDGDSSKNCAVCMHYRHPPANSLSSIPLS